MLPNRSGSGRALPFLLKARADAKSKYISHTDVDDKVKVKIRLLNLTPVARDFVAKKQYGYQQTYLNGH